MNTNYTKQNKKTNSPRKLSSCEVLAACDLTLCLSLLLQFVYLASQLRGGTECACAGEPQRKAFWIVESVRETMSRRTYAVSHLCISFWCVVKS